MNTVVEAPIQEAASQANLADTRIAAKAFAESYDGPYRNAAFTFGNRMIKQLFKRENEILHRNAVYTTFFSRLVFDDAVIDPVEASLFKRVEKINRKFDTEMGQAEAVAKASNISEEDMSENSLPEQVDVKITSPLYGDILKLMHKGDRLLSWYSTLWLNGAITALQFKERTAAVRKDLRGTTNSVRAAWISLQRQVQQGNVGKLKELAAKAKAEQGATKKAATAQPTAKKPSAPKQAKKNASEQTELAIDSAVLEVAVTRAEQQASETTVA